MSNYERLVEVSEDAYQSEDAGLIQYSKTLDSLDTKLNNISTSFQQFYMSIFNGPTIKAGLDAINNIIQGFNNVGVISSFGTILTLINSLKNLANIGIGKISIVRQLFQYNPQEVYSLGQQIGVQLGEGVKNGIQSSGAANLFNLGSSTGVGSSGSIGFFGKLRSNKKALVATRGVGAALSTGGLLLNNSNPQVGSIMSALGNVAMGATAGPWGAALAAIISLPGIINSFANRLEIQAQQSAQAAEEANVRRATTKDRYQNIKEGLSNLEELEKYQNGSVEQRKEWIDANNALAESFPELIGYYDQEGNAIIDLADKYDILNQARQEAADAAIDSAGKQIIASQDEYAVEYKNYIEDIKSSLITPISMIETGLFDPFQKESDPIRSMVNADEDGDVDEDYKHFVAWIDSIPDINSFIKAITDSNGVNLQFMYDVLEKAASDTSIPGQHYEPYFETLKSLFIAEGITVDEESGKLQFPPNWNVSALDSFTSLEGSYQDVENYKKAYRATLVNNELLFEEGLVDFYDAAAKMATESISTESMVFDSSGQLSDDSKESIQSSIQKIINGFIVLEKKLSDKTSKQFLSLISDFDSGNLLTKDFNYQIGKVQNEVNQIQDEEDREVAQEVIKKYRVNAGNYEQEIAYILTEISKDDAIENIDIITSLDTSSISKNSADQLKELYYDYTAETDDILVETYKSQFQTFLKALSSASQENEDSSTIQQMLSEAAESGDLYTYAGIQNLNKQFEENEIDFQLDFNIISETTTNLVTNYQSLMDSIAKNIESASEMVEKATKGMDYEEASTLAAKLGTTLSDSNFEIVDGKFIYKDVETIYDSYNEGLLDVYKQINSAYEDQIAQIYLSDDTSKTLISRYSGIDATDENIFSYRDEAIDALNKSKEEAIKVAQEYYHNNLQLDVASVMDSIMEGISEGLQQLANSFSGELSAEEWTKLRQQYNISGTGILTNSGYLLDQKTQDELGVALRREATKSGKLSDYEFAKMYYEAISGTENFSNSIYDLQQRMEDAQDEAKELYEDLLKIAQLDESAAEFTFMEDHPLEGWTNNFDNFVSQIDAVKNAFSSFQSEGSIGYQGFLNMMDFMSTAGEDTEGFKNFEKQLNSTGKTYEQFVNNVLQNSEEWGKVDIGTIAAEMGISVDAAMGMMAEGMTDGLKAVAQQQIDYLSGLEEMLEALAMLEAMGDIETTLSIGLGFEFNRKPATIEDLPAILSSGELDEDFIIKAITDSLKNSENSIAQEIYNAIAGEDGIIDAIELGFFGGIVDGINKGSLDPKALEDLSQAQAEAVANAMTSINPEDFIKDDGKMDYESFFSAVTDMINEGLKHASEESFGSTISLALRNLGISFETDGSSITLDGQDWSNKKEQIIEALAAQNLAVAGETTIDGGKVVVNVVPEYQVAPDEFLDQNNFKQEGDSGLLSSEITIPTGTIKVRYQPESAEFYFDVPEGMTEEDAWAGLKEAFGMDDEADFTIDENGNRSFKMSFGIAEDSLSGADLATIRAEIEQIKALVSGGMELVINTTAAKTNIDLIIDALNSLQSLLSGMLKGDIQLTITGGDIPSGEDSGGTLNSEQVIHVIWDFDSPPEVNTPQTIDVNWNAPAPPFIKNPQYIDIIYRELNKPRYMIFTGTVNDVTGPSYASGNVGSNAINASRIATKTLVGELGPELAIYNGSYHLLGQDGAEFVNLPKDAIVFNHLQTAGIISGQMKNQRGLPLDRALAFGNVSGPALASGVQDALAAVRRAKSVWQGLLNNLSVADLLGSGGGSGGGGSSDNPDLTPYIADLQEWYNLSRQIVDLEQRINKLIAERENISDGGKYLRNLRETQSLLQDQLNTQKDLYKYQLDEVARQGEAINNDSLLRQFYHVDENGLLQYNEGNETNGGKGALEILDELNKMTNINDQVARIESFGFSHTNKYRETLEGEEYVSAFFEALQTPIDNLDSLRDTVLETEETMADLQTSIEEINQEIRENQLDLEENIYNIIVEERQENIALLKEQNSLIKEANSSYLSGIQTALDQEKQLYEQNRAINDREVLQRQLSLLRRSGGSASEISSLEQQLDEALQNEYFSNQEKTIEEIQKANEEQTKLMDRQVKLQEEALAYDKENGVIWLKVYEVMAGSREEILEFMQGHSVDFFEKSAFVQEDMLLDWAKKAGIYDENKVFEYQQKEAKKTMSNIWNTDTGKKLKGTWDTFNAETQQDIIDEYLTRYANQVMSGVSVEEAVSKAQEEFYEHIENEKKRLEENVIKNKSSSSNSGSSSSSSSSGGGGGSSSKSSGGTKYYLVNPETGRVTYTTNRGTAANAVNKGYTSTTSLSEANKKSDAIKKQKKYSTGGLVDYTGIAIVHGSKTKPEGFINAEQTKALLTGLNLIKDINNYSNMQNTLRSLVSNPISEFNSPNNQTNINVSQGAIQINIDQLNDEYDIERISNDIMSRMYDIAAKASSRGVNRR